MSSFSLKALVGTALTTIVVQYSILERYLGVVSAVEPDLCPLGEVQAGVEPPGQISLGAVRDQGMGPQLVAHLSH